MNDDNVKELESRIEILEHIINSHYDYIHELNRVNWLNIKIYKFVEWVNSKNKKIYEFLCKKMKKRLIGVKVNE